MSAYNFAQSSGEISDLKQPSREPSMEEILASIRRIITQDQALFAAEDGSCSESDLSDGVDGAPVHELGQDLQTPPGTAEGESADGFHRAYARDASDAMADGAAGPLASPETGSSVGQAFNALVASRFAQNSEAILAMTREALRPMLQAWLDAHLPALVERLVRAEIERMTMGA